MWPLRYFGAYLAERYWPWFGATPVASHNIFRVDQSAGTTAPGIFRVDQGGTGKVFRIDQGGTGKVFR